jgi:hypothetical protein
LGKPKERTEIDYGEVFVAILNRVRNRFKTKASSLLNKVDEEGRPVIKLNNIKKALGDTTKLMVKQAAHFLKESDLLEEQSKNFRRTEQREEAEKKFLKFQERQD